LSNTVVSRSPRPYWKRGGPDSCISQTTEGKLHSIGNILLRAQVKFLKVDDDDDDDDNNNNNNKL